jgi:membrane fusion protein (multidrug efflux system)
VLQAKRAALARAQASLLGARKMQSYALVTSPVDGVIGTLPYKQGSLVNGAQTEALTTVSSIGSVRAYFSVNEKVALSFAQNRRAGTQRASLRQLDSVQLVLSDGTVYDQPGRVEAASGLIDTKTGSATARASFPNPNGVLRSGATGLVRLPQTLPNSLLVPQAATVELQGKRFVYVVAAGNKVVNTEIKVLTLPAGLNYVVSSGLKAGDRLVTEGVSTLQDGQQIVPRPDPAAPTASAH